VRTRSLIPAALLLCGCGLRRPSVPPEPVRGPSRDSLFRFDQSRSDTVAARGFVDGQLALLVADAAYLRAGAPPVFGRDAIRSLLSAKSTTPSPVTWEPLGGNVSADLLSAYTFGVTAHDDGGRRVRMERYIAFWERTRGRAWRIAAYAEVGGPTSVGDIGVAAQTLPPERPAVRQVLQQRDALRAADSAFSDLSYRMGSAYAFSNMATSDAVLFGSPELLIGPRAIREAYDARSVASSLTWRPIYAYVSVSNDLGFTIGESISTGRGPSGAAVQRFGKYLTVWRRENGTWRFVVDGGNSSPMRP
jgi:ketosteroid isomerase-like protein